MFGPALADGHARIHHIAPRARIVSAVLLSVAFSALAQPAAALAALLIALALAAAAPLHPGVLLRRLLPVNAIVLMLGASLYLGEYAYPAGIDPGHDTALLAFKANAIVVVLAVCLGTLDPLHLGAGLRALHCPPPLAQLLVLTTRYIYLFHEEYLRLREAMRLRSFTPRTGRHTLRTLGYLAANLLLRAHDRAHRIHDAMRCRGYTGHLPLDAAPRLAPHDWAAMLAAAGCAMALLWAGRA